MIRALTEIAWEWGCRCFGLDHMTNKNVRALRFAEEALELAQACGVSEEKALALVRMVYSRPAGDVRQEIGGSMVTLSVLARLLGYDVESAFSIEVRRCLTKDPAHFAQRNKEKIDLGMA
jgi:NTP pyrophosphatase (non-canonical NTP hydrolase)